MKQKILITGGAGYIGSVLSKDLIDKGYRVTVFDNFLYKQNSLLDLCYHSNLNIIIDDVRNVDSLKKQFDKHDIIIPLAAIVGAPACDNDQVLSKQVNQIQAENIAKWASPSQMVLFPVTNSGYGIGQEGIYCDENSPLNPISHYGKTKVQAEKALLDMGNAVTFRLATVFGASPRMRMDLLVNDFVYRAYKDKIIVLFESHFKRNYIHIRDLSLVFLHTIKNYSKMKGEAYNIGLSNANLSKIELCNKIKEQISNFQILESDIGKDPDKRDYIVSNKKIESTGWQPRYSLEDGISELIKAYSYLTTNRFNNV